MTTSDTSVSLRTRQRCPACGGGNHTGIWSDGFDSDTMRRWWSQQHYDGNVADVLAGERFELVACSDCAMRYQRQVLDDAGLMMLYSQWISPAQIDRFEAELFGGMTAERTFETARALVKHVLRLQRLLGADAHGQPIKLLDFGCGDGQFVKMAGAFGFESCGVDFSASRQERAGSDGMRLVPDLEAFDELGTGPLDAASLFEVLEHLDEPRTVLASLHQRMRPGAVLLIEVPDCSGIDRPESLDHFNLLNPLEHINVFVPDTLAAMCAVEGFTPIAKFPAHVTTKPLDLPRAVVSRVLNRPTTRAYFRRG